MNKSKLWIVILLSIAVLGMAGVWTLTRKMLPHRGAAEELADYGAVPDARLVEPSDDRRAFRRSPGVVCVDVGDLDPQAVDHPRVLVHPPLGLAALSMPSRPDIALWGREEDRRAFEVELGM